MSDVIRESASSRPEDRVLLIGHGSKDGSNSRTVEALAEVLRRDRMDVSCCYNEFEGPGIEEALASMGGGSDILAVPVFVSPSFHSETEVPTRLGVDGSTRTGIFGGCRIRYAREIGLNQAMGNVLLAMLEDLGVTGMHWA